jgi:hypothetical protein
MPVRVIQNFGLFWDREHIDWGSRGPGHAGHLKGYLKNSRFPVDFRQQRGIYVLYEGQNIATQRTVYVGQAGARENDLFHRLRNHRDKDLWNRWQRFSWFGFLQVGHNRQLVHRNKTAIGNVAFSAALNQVEAVIMELFEPVKNRQGQRWHGAREYRQLRKDFPSA